jgi:hypothetical protein
MVPQWLKKYFPLFLGLVVLLIYLVFLIFVYGLESECKIT